jgi:predicted O-methyltransferase YrrM
MIVERMRKLAKEILPKNMQIFVKKNFHTIGALTWATKSYETWLVLQNLLYLVRPKKLVEFGSGRSTHYLAEYALKFGAELISIEQNLAYCMKVNSALKLGFLPSGVVRHAPIRGDWYDVNVVEKSLASVGNFDFLFIDGPAEFGPCHRNSKKIYTSVFPRLDHIKMIVIDDVHLKECHDMALYLMKKHTLQRCDINYNGTNTLAFLLGKGYSENFSKLPHYLRDLLSCVE